MTIKLVNEFAYFIIGCGCRHFTTTIVSTHGCSKKADLYEFIKFLVKMLKSVCAKTCVGIKSVTSQ